MKNNSRRSRQRVRVASTALFLLLLVAVVVRAALPTDANDFLLPGSQPGQSGTIETPDQCVSCHGNYDPNSEAYFGWRGSMMAHAARDPLFHAAMAIANQDAPESGELCIRCHAPKGWLEGRSTPTDGSALTAADRQGVQCGFCHQMIRPAPVGVNPYSADSLYTAGGYALDQAFLGTLAAIPPSAGSGMYVVDANDVRRGPYANITNPPHSMSYSPFMRDAAFCGTCHDVSNPLYSRDSTGAYVANAHGAPAPSAGAYDLFPIERTYSEWARSAYNTPEGVYAPQFGGNKTYVSTCQDCHMRDVTGKGAKSAVTPVRNDLGLHDLTGGNTFVPRLVAALYPTEVDTAAISAGIVRATAMLQKAATLELEVSPLWEGFRARVRVTNETGHKLPSGYPEGRRMWLQVSAWDAADSLVYASGAYDAATGVLTLDPDIKLYETKPGISTAMSPMAGIAAGPSFHFILNDSIYFDNRIPPRGFTNAAFAAIQAPPVGATYADGQYWDETDYVLPAPARRFTARLLYQTASKEYIEFLRTENTTNAAGQTMYDLWAAHGRSEPVVMAAVSDTFPQPTQAAPAVAPERPTLASNLRGDGVRFRFHLPHTCHVQLYVYDVASRRVATLADAWIEAGTHDLDWPAHSVASGVYFARLQTPLGIATSKIHLVR